MIVVTQGDSRYSRRGVRTVSVQMIWDPTQFPLFNIH